ERRAASARTGDLHRRPARALAAAPAHGRALEARRDGSTGRQGVIEARILGRRLATLGRPRILIVGDLILDRYVTGDVLRISPEAPIPVLSARSSEMRLGGAGNVASNLQ